MNSIMKRLIIDIDDTLSFNTLGDYKVAQKNQQLIDTIKVYKQKGFEIVFNSSRNMRTFDGNVGKINVNTLPVILNWLDSNGVPYDEVYVGKPWCGLEGFYVDDKAIRPAEFVKHTYDELLAIIKRDTLEPDA